MTSTPIHTRLAKSASFRSRHALDVAIAMLRGNGMTAYWYSEIVNFGDLITPLLLRYYGFSPILTWPIRAELVATGSILEHLQNNYEGIILGSGFIDERSSMSFPKARVLAVRGALTLKRMGRGSDVALGDPGLLASVVMPRREQKKYALGIIPHHSEKAHPVNRQLAEQNRTSFSVIDVKQKPLKVFREIDQCEYIVSSSLHGLIVADSLGIPNAWLGAQNLLGGRFKFDDYYSSLGIECNPITLREDVSLPELIEQTTSKPVAEILHRKQEMHGLWARLGRTVHSRHAN